jgi:hypothetical protein
VRDPGPPALGPPPGLPHEPVPCGALAPLPAHAPLVRACCRDHVGTGVWIFTFFTAAGRLNVPRRCYAVAWTTGVLVCAAPLNPPPSPSPAYLYPFYVFACERVCIRVCVSRLRAHTHRSLDPSISLLMVSAVGAGEALVRLSNGRIPLVSCSHMVHNRNRTPHPTPTPLRSFIKAHTIARVKASYGSLDGHGGGRGPMAGVVCDVNVMSCVYVV